MRVIVSLLLLSSAAQAQQMRSPTYTIDSVASVGAGGGASTAPGIVSFLSLPSAGGGKQSSLAYDAAAGFIEAYDPKLPPIPVVYGLGAGFGPHRGGRALTITGANFDLGSSLAVHFGGVAATDVVMSSSTVLTCTTPPGSKGPVQVTVSSTAGASTAVAPYVYTPAVTISPTASPGARVTLTNYGPPGGLFYTLLRYASPGVPAYGNSFLESSLFAGVLAHGTPYPVPDGVHVRSLTIPAVPGLSGGRLFVETLAITSFSPPRLQRTNTAVTVIP